MVRIFKTIDGAIHEIQEPQEGCWIALTNPTATEIFEISEQFGIEVDDLRAPLQQHDKRSCNYCVQPVHSGVFEHRRRRSKVKQLLLLIQNDRTPEDCGSYR